MTKKILILLVLGIVAALPNLALAQLNPLWTGDVSSEFGDPGNWVIGGSAATTLGDIMNRWATSTLEVKGGDLSPYYSGPSPNIPEITTQVETYADGYRCVPGQFRLFSDNGANVDAVANQTDGNIVWANGAGSASIPYAVSICSDWHVGSTSTGILNMTGGSMISPSLGLGLGPYAVDPDPIYGWGEGPGVLNIWGTANFTIQALAGYHIERLTIAQHPDWDPGMQSKIDIRDNGTLVVPIAFASLVDGYIASGEIVAGTPGDSLYNIISGDTYVIFASPIPPIPGDADLDQDVDEADLTILASNWLGDTGMNWTTGDFNFDGVVNEEDASMLAANLGVGVPPAASVPEPGSLLLLCLGLGCVTLLRRK